MKGLRNILFAAIILILSSCGASSNVSSYWVNSIKADCEAIIPVECLLVQQSDTINPEGWDSFYSPIEGFEYEMGYIYHLKVKELQSETEEVAADASSVQYSLVKVLSKELDAKLLLNDIWVVTSILGNVVNERDDDSHKDMTLELHLKDMMAVGCDGCNNFMGSINIVGQSELSFRPMSGTRMICSDMTFPDLYTSVLTEVRHYKVDGMILYLYNDDGNELLVLKKVD